ncbi:MAG: hypothetical protein A2Y45_04600 [Tenericutes bacterium GWC2_34_14]|nr:MAG: hypothetical protein A2Y45_04600 [Tenericutes bacterium GWC2_34_14]OHE38485.1 MAG: hypothetical protein A2Y44_08145 [Tenericutes bacterium GWF2_35_184]OHE45545.1 MAG: hypothetical protein A3K26_03650 [Tenericutes bacterium RIFOXYA12_FULL_35_10]OHE47663.1 MAG: hypothetical protein A2449_08800 [Tenericutes bacterium RIFOXYC2_FULL_35_27]OHE53070.1 MAG: hypothetical protein A2558_04080 [Tenericutes bacterium RIFOXYD2_FULL_35_11]
MISQILKVLFNSITLHMYMTQEMLVDPSRESFILIGVAIFLVGFINGAINTAGLAAVIATGGTSAYAIEAINGFVGGFL